MQNIVNKDISMRTAVLIFLAIVCIVFIIQRIQDVRDDFLRTSYKRPKYPIFVRILSFIALSFICIVIGIVSSLALSIGYMLCSDAGIPIKEATGILDLLLRSMVSSVGITLILVNIIIIILAITILIIGIKKYFINPESEEDDDDN